MTFEKLYLSKLTLIMVVVAAILFTFVQAQPGFAQSPQSANVGIEGVLPSEPPAQAPTITLPGNGQSFSNNPVVVRGICLPDLEVRIYKNGVFSGAVRCNTSGSYEIEIDLFTGQNILLARQFDSLSQPSPDSNVVTVSYVNPASDDGFEQLVISSNFSTRGANPGDKLVWPLAISGGLGPYALSVDWGDGTIVPVSLNFAGEFEIDHIYSQPGVYKVVVRATDSRGKTAFIQLIAVANGPLETANSLSETGGEAGDEGAGRLVSSSKTYIIWPVYFLFFFVISTFWIGRRYERRRIKEMLYNRQSVNF